MTLSVSVLFLSVAHLVELKRNINDRKRLEPLTLCSGAHLLIIKIETVKDVYCKHSVGMHFSKHSKEADNGLHETLTAHVLQSLSFIDDKQEDENL